MMKRMYVVLMVMALSCFTMAAPPVPVTDGLIIHLDAGAITGLNDGDTVTSWADSATGDTVDGSVTQVSTGPTYVANGLNGNAVVRMAEGQLMASGLLTLPNVDDGLTYFVVAKGDQGGATAERVMQLGLTGSDNRGKTVGFDFSTNKTGGDGGSGARFNNGKGLVLTNNPLTTGFHIAILQIDQGEAYDQLRYYVDDLTQEILDNIANPANTLGLEAANNELTLGTGINPDGTAYQTADQYQGDIAEILIYNNQLSQAQMQDVLDYLNAKYYQVIAWGPTPADEAVGQGTPNNGQVDVTLSWNTGVDPDDFDVPNPDITKHYVYVTTEVVGGEPNFAAAGTDFYTVNAPTNSQSITADYSTTIYWRVDESILVDSVASGPNDPNTLTGAAWSFETLAEAPIIISSPADLVRFPSTDPDYEGSAVFSCVFSTLDPTPVVQWFAQSDPNNAIVSAGRFTISTVADTPEVGQWTSTLTISDVETGDEDSYYCVVTDDEESLTTQSASADLGVRRLVGYWPLDGNYLDLSGEGHDADPNLAPDPSQWVDGVDPTETNQALDLEPKRLSAADTGDWAATAFTGQFTVSAWVNWAGGDSWQGIFSNRNTPGESNFYIEIRADNNNVQIGGSGFGNALQSESLPIGQWTHVVITNGPDGTVIYFDGDIKASSATVWSANQNAVGAYLGCLQRDNGTLASLFNGILDDVKVYNYAWTHEDVAQEYFDILEEATCLNEPELDTNGDCVVDLQDLAALAASWLINGLCPGQACP